MKKVKITLLGVLLIAIVSCKKAEKIEIEKPTDRIVSTIAGSGAATLMNGIGVRAAFKNPQKLATDASGNIYIAEEGNHVIRKVTPAGVVTVFAGTGISGYADGNGQVAQFNHPIGIAISSSGNIYVADGANNCIRKITPAGIVSTFAGLGGTNGFADGTGTEARFNYPFGLAIDKSDNIFVADIGNNRIRKITSSGVVTTFVGNGQSNLVDGPIATATMYNPAAIVFDSSGNMYVTQSSFIRKISTDGTVSVFAGSSDSDRGNGYLDGANIAARFFYLYDLTIDKKGNLYAADSENNVIRKITPDGIVSTYAGSKYDITDINSGRYKDGPAAGAYFYRPQGINVDNEGNLIVSENNGNHIRKISEVPLPDSPDDIARKNWNKPAGWK